MLSTGDGTLAMPYRLLNQILHVQCGDAFQNYLYFLPFKTSSELPSRIRKANTSYNLQMLQHPRYNRIRRPRRAPSHKTNVLQIEISEVHHTTASKTLPQIRRLQQPQGDRAGKVKSKISSQPRSRWWKRCNQLSINILMQTMYHQLMAMSHLLICEFEHKEIRGLNSITVYEAENQENLARKCSLKL